MILNTLDERRQHNQSHVASAEEGSERFNSGLYDALGYRILGQFCQLLVLLTNAPNSLSMATSTVSLEGRSLWAQNLHP